MRRIVGVAALGALAACTYVLGTSSDGGLTQALPWVPVATAGEQAPPLKPRTVRGNDLSELSGLAASRRHPGVLYAINDSGDDPAVYAIGRRGKILARIVLPGATNVDWEALAPAWDEQGEPVLWIGDIGDNSASRSNVTLYRIAEPAALESQSAAWQRFTLTYRDGPRNAESLAIDPTSGGVFILSKESGAGGLYRARGLSAAGPVDPTQDPAELVRVRSTPGSITDAAFELSPEGNPRLVAVDYLRIHSSEDRGEHWTSRFAPLQPQREAVAWAWHGPDVRSDEVYLGSEGVRSDIVAAGIP